MSRLSDKRRAATRQQLASAIRAALNSKGISMWELSRRAGIGRGVVQGIVGARSSPRLETLDAIGEVLDLNVVIAPRELFRSA